MRQAVSVKPRVSVLIPTFNRATLLLEAVASVQAQSYSDWEIIVADDGSSDDTCQRLADLAEDRLEVLLFEHSGNPARLRNAAAAAATGEYLAFLDSDDLWHPNKLQRQLDALAAFRGASWSFTDFDRVDPEGQRVGRSLPRIPPEPQQLPTLVLGLRIGLTTPTVLVRRDLFMELGGFDESLSHCEDYDLWIRLALHADAAPVPEVLVVTRYEPDHYGSPPLEVSRSWVAVYRKHLELPDDDLASLARDQCVRFELQLTREYLRRGSLVRASTSMLAALRLDPRSPIIRRMISRGLGRSRLLFR